MFLLFRHLWMKFLCGTWELFLTQRTTPETLWTTHEVQVPLLHSSATGRRSPSRTLQIPLTIETGLFWCCFSPSSITGRQLCSGITKTGKACKKRALLGQEYCRVHEGGHTSYTHPWQHYWDWLLLWCHNICISVWSNWQVKLLLCVFL